MSEQFTYATPLSSKVTCTTCGRCGWGPLEPTLKTALPWQLSCMNGHPFPCICGKRLATPSAFASHVRKAKGVHGRATDSAP